MTPRRLATLLLFLSCACASGRRAQHAELPFHVAVIPFIEGQAPAAQEGELTLSLDPDAVTRAALNEIRAGCFTRATLLAYPAGVSRAEFTAWSADERDTHWVRAAEVAQADLLLECELKYAKTLRGQANEKFWLNLPLFAFGGPLCYFVDDRTYEGNARLRAALHDLNPILEGRASLSDGRSRLTDVTPRFERTQLDFLERNGGRAERLLASLIVPAGFLARSGERVERGIARRVEGELARRLSAELFEARQEVLEASQVSAFYLESAPEARVEGESVLVRATVLLRLGQVERLDTWSLRHGGAEASGSFGEPAPAPELSTQRESFVRYTLEARIPRAAGGDHVRLEIVAGGREALARSFTVALR